MAAGAEVGVERGQQRRQQQAEHDQPHAPRRQQVARGDDPVGLVRERGAARAAARPVQREDRAQRAAAHPGELLARDRRVRRRAALAADLQQHGGQARAVDLALLGDRERQRAARPLRARPRPARVGAGLLPRGGLDRPLSAIGGLSRPFDHGTTHGLCHSRDARSPSTSTPSIRAGSCARAQARAPRRRRSRRRSRPGPASCAGRGRRAAAGRRRGRSASASAPASRVRKIRPSSSSAAVPDNSARPGLSVASRWVRTTIRRSDSPGRTPITVSRLRSPSTVRPLVVLRSTSNPEPRSDAATRSASASSPAEPGSRSGNALPSCSSEPASRSLPYARLGSNASATARVRTGVGRPWSEKATTKMASRAGMKAAR